MRWLVRAALEWDVHADVDALLVDYYARWFGPAAAPMKDDDDALEDAFEPESWATSQRE